jgi:hypothetical protein
MTLIDGQKYLKASGKAGLNIDRYLYVPERFQAFKNISGDSLNLRAKAFA